MTRSTLAAARGLRLERVQASPRFRGRGTFNLARHAWGEPAETLLELGARQRVELVMPRLGAPVEPARVEGVEPWWRALSGVRGRGSVPLVAS
ncbi:MAG TPA: hypothetical protein VFS43_10140 [Polyangiaceae bacterium]|nr:hypothetical protein [Polyangiaceae bacterium]